MTTPSLLRMGTALLCLAIAAGPIAGCAGKKTPEAAPAKPAAAPPAKPAAATPAAPPATAKPAAPTGAAAPAPLTGHVTRAALENYEAWKALRAQDYTPDAAAVRTIAERARNVRVLAIVATWCPDSKREVPRFFKIYDQAKLGMKNVTLVAVDRTKKDAEGLTVKHNILRVPTFVFFRGEKEIGRVIERATTTLEGDIAGIVAK